MKEVLCHEFAHLAAEQLARVQPRQALAAESGDDGCAGGRRVLAHAPGAPVTVYVEEGGTFVHLGRLTTTRTLLPGESEQMSMAYDFGTRPANEVVRFRVVVDDPTDMPSATLVECHDDNNTAETMGSCQILM